MDNSFIIKVGIAALLCIVYFVGSQGLFPAINNQSLLIYGALFLFFIFIAYVPSSLQGQKFKVIFLLVLCFGGLAFYFFGFLPPRLSTDEERYMQHFNTGYECFRNRDLECSVREYKLAENLFDTDIELYVRKAWMYERMNEYEKAIECANKALKLDEKDSIYKKANGFRFSLNSEISIYTTLGDCNYRLKRYKEAKEAFTYVINNVTYTYSDAYLKRGLCEYYLGEKENALFDFDRHKNIIQSYLDDQAQTDYPAKYPTYNQQDLINLDGWIKATRSL